MNRVTKERVKGEDESQASLTCDDSDDTGVELVLVGGSFVFVGKTLPPSEGGGGQDFHGKKVPKEVVDVAIGIGATKLKIITGRYGYSASQVQLRRRGN